MIPINAPDGSVVNFPDGTDDNTITKVMAQNYPHPDLQSSDPRDVTANRIANSTDRGDVEKSLEIGSQLGLGPVVDAVTSALTPPKSYSDAVSNTIQALPDLGVGKAVDSGVNAVSNLYNKIPQRGRDIIEAAALPASLFPASIAKDIVVGGSTLGARRTAAILKDVQPGITKLAPAVEAAGHSSEVPVMGGLWNKTIETPSPSELDAANEVANIKGYNIKASNLAKHNAVNNAIGEEAVRLRNALGKETFSLTENVPESIPMTQDQFGNRVQGQPIPAYVRNKFHPVLESIQNDISSNATLTGDARAVASDVVAKTKELMEKNPPTLAGLLDTRQEIDKWARLSDKKFFDKTGARQYAVKEIRDSINNFIDENAHNVAVKDSLKKQSSLYRAKDVLQTKAGEDMRFNAINTAYPLTLAKRAKKVVKHGASYVGLAK